jgi:hypothetical protein
MTATEKLREISTLDANLARWIADARDGGMSDNDIIGSLTRAMDAVEDERDSELDPDRLRDDWHERQRVTKLFGDE